MIQRENSTDEQILNDFYNELWLDNARHLRLFHSAAKNKDYSYIWSLADLEIKLKNNDYPKIAGAKEILMSAIKDKQMILCSGLEHRGSAL